MCIFCEDFKLQICGRIELDSKRISFGRLGDRELDVVLNKRYTETYLMTMLDEDILTSVPISYCPMCGEKLGGLTNDII